MNKAVSSILILSPLRNKSPGSPTRIQAKAGERGVAIILSLYDTLTTVEKVEQFFGKTCFH